MLSDWQLLSQVFTAETIMTPWEEVLCWDQDTAKEPVLEKARHQFFDLLPVISAGRVSGIIEVREERYSELTLDWLVSRDTPIPDLIDLFAESSHKGLLVLSRQEVVGVVTIADINKMPARTYLYNLIAELEVKLAAAIHHHYDGDDVAVLDLLGKTETTQTIRAMSPSMRTTGVDIGALQLLTLSDLVNVLAKTRALFEEMDFRSRSHVEDQLNGIASYRNNVMHSVRPLLTTSHEVKKLRDRIRRAQEAVSTIDKYLNKRKLGSVPAAVLPPDKDDSHEPAG